QYRLTAASLQALEAAGVPAAVAAKLAPVKGIAYKDRAEFLDAISDDFTTDELKQYKDTFWQHLHKETGVRFKQPAVGEASTPIWLPSPLKVARAFVHAFVKEPNPGDPWLHQSLWHSCQIIFWGFFLSAVIGVPLGILCGT